MKLPTSYMVNVPAIEYASELVEVIPCADQIRFTASGAEATFMAMRLARAFTGREKFQIRGCNHGNHDYSMWNYNPPATLNNHMPVADTAACLQPLRIAW